MPDNKSILVLALLYAANGYAGVHKCKDAKGNILYTDKVCSNKDRKSVAVAQTNEITAHSSKQEISTPVDNNSIKTSLNQPLKNIETSERQHLPRHETPKQASFFSAIVNKIRNFIGNAPDEPALNAESAKPAKLKKQPEYQCDGRTYCSQMTSCDEATFFINNCPDTKMDGDFDGIPCESQWC